MKQLSELIYTLFCLATAMVGYYRHGSILCSIIDFILAPLVWCKWLLLHQVNITMIKHTFEFFIQ